MNLVTNGRFSATLAESGLLSGRNCHIPQRVSRRFSFVARPHAWCYSLQVPVGAPSNSTYLREIPLFQGNLGWWNIIHNQVGIYHREFMNLFFYFLLGTLPTLVNTTIFISLFPLLYIFKFFGTHLLPENLGVAGVSVGRLVKYYNSARPIEHCIVSPHFHHELLVG